MSEAGLLGTVERYFAEIMPIPRLQQRIDCFIFTRSFEPAMQRVSTQHCAASNLLEMLILDYDLPGCKPGRHSVLVMRTGPAKTCRS